MELLLLAPNTLGVDVEDVEVVELVVLVGLLAKKENAGFGAAAESVGKKIVFLIVHGTQQLKSCLLKYFDKYEN